uniref:Monocarboxylate transporter 12-like n=1 Tax=Saccoglossus kowalevskii TaxID=10224 RepID=A0ABM0M7F7_SACKO|nr:PREDICTED: monocarboxylate transporter 12-like [Saccoglossus kowalevskii]
MLLQKSILCQAEAVEIKFIKTTIERIGFAFLYGQSIIIVGKYFHKRHALANGIVYAGGAIGIMALPPLYQLLINRYGWKGTMMVLSGINLHIVVCGMLMRPPPPPKHDPDATLDTTNPAPLTMAESNVVSQDIFRGGMKGTLEETNNKQCEDDQSDEFVVPTGVVNGNNKKKPKKLQTKIAVRLGLHLFTDSWFCILCCTALMSATGHMGMMGHLVSKAVSAKIHKLDAAFLMTITGIGALVGRATHGWFVDLGHFSPMFFVACAWCAAGTSMLLFMVANGNYIVYACLSASYGFLSGIAIPLNGAVCMKACLPIDIFSTAFGWFLLMLGLGNLLGPVLGGWVYDVTSNYNLSFLLAGSILILTGLLIFMQIIHKRCQRKEPVDKDVKEEPLMGISRSTDTASETEIQKVTILYR